MTTGDDGSFTVRHTTPPHPVDISKDKLTQLTVAEIKAELLGRNVHPPSKLRKPALLELLIKSLNLPVVAEQHGEKQPTQRTQKQKSKAKNWKTSDPIRKLLYFEFKEGNVPLDANEMGPAEIHCRYHDTEEFEGTSYDDSFIQCLKSLRTQILKEEPLLKWNEFHPTRAFLVQEISDGNVPESLTAAEAWCTYAATPQFKVRGMKYGETFKRRLLALRKIIMKDKGRAAMDKLELARAIRNHPPPTHNHRGEPQWNGSKAQASLKEDMANNEHLKLKPHELRLKANRPEYQAYSKDTFRWKTHQEVKTKKYLHTLKHDAEQKLRKNLKKMTIQE